jgi:TorA maturation chaperone TorD
LGYLLSTKGIKASLDKIRAIIQMQPLQMRKEVQKLTDHIATLYSFIANLTKKSHPFFSILRGSKKVD